MLNFIFVHDLNHGYGSTRHHISGRKAAFCTCVNDFNRGMLELSENTVSLQRRIATLIALALLYSWWLRGCFD